MDLVTVGTVAFDNIETPFGSQDRVVGGAATYISLAASYFTNKIGLVSVIGDDFPQEMLNELKDRGTDLAGLQVKEGEKSFFWAGRYHFDMNTRDTLDTQLNVLADFDPIVPANYQNPNFLMLGNLDPIVQTKVLDQLESRPKLVALDTMNFWMDSAMLELKEVIARVDLLSINDEEARQLTGEHSLVRAARKILKMGPKFLVVKKGEHGALLFQGERMFFAPALPLEDIVDPTGAGDTFAGGMMGYLARTGSVSFPDLKRAIIVGSAMASFCCEAFGPQKILELNQDKINERIALFVDLVDMEADVLTL
jgi:sugar/nucleoside kinase (ribokinase family)